MRQPTALTFVLLLAGGPCLADDVDCSAEALGNATQLTLNICAQRDTEASDRARDATCEFETTANADGSIRPIVIAGCRA